jgi:hypothetical protein
MIGGPLQRIFGKGVKDVAVSTLARLGFLSHTIYWTRDCGKSQHVVALREALDLLNKRDKPVAYGARDPGPAGTLPRLPSEQVGPTTT